MGQSRF